MTQSTDTPEVLKQIAEVSGHLDKITTAIERLDHNVQEMRLEVKIFQARIEEKFNSIDQRFNSIDQRLERLEKRGDTQDTRFWGLVALLATALLGVEGKVVFFPVDRL
jgi:predicted  nucleic acid-binding Zn-ribbon protein